MDLSGYSLTITSGVRGIDVKIKELALRQGGTRLTGHTYPKLMQTRRRMTKIELFRQRKTKKYSVLQERYHENDVAFLLFFYRFLT